MKFQCLESCGGKCCKVNLARPAYIFLTSDDIDRLSAFLGVKHDKFADIGLFANTRFTKKRSYQWYVKNSGEKCRFLKNGKCSVYEARPTQCRTFPFWPELVNPMNWSKTSEYCPGIGQGDAVDPAPQLKEQAAADKELTRDTVGPD